MHNAQTKCGHGLFSRFNNDDWMPAILGGSLHDVKIKVAYAQRFWNKLHWRNKQCGCTLQQTDRRTIPPLAPIVNMRQNTLLIAVITDNDTPRRGFRL